MRKICCTCAVFLILSMVDGQKVQYVNRFRNFSIESETGDIYLINCTIHQHNMDHVLTGSFHVVRDLSLKSIIVYLYRCTFENSACEYFQKWKFLDRNAIKSVIYMKNQIWTPLFENLVPKLDAPLIKKSIYKSTGATLDAKAALIFYPDATKYFWRAHFTAIDTNDKKVVTVTCETSFFTFVERDRKRDRGTPTTSNP